MPGGGITADGFHWKQGSKKYMFPYERLKPQFRKRMLARLDELKIPYHKKLKYLSWVVNIEAVGDGEPALKYLSRYLYRGVISQRDIVKDQDGMVTFQYEENKTKIIRHVTLPAADFIMRLLRHVLPKRFRRIRDVGFHHGNAKRTLTRIQLALAKAPIAAVPRTEKPKPKCRTCGTCLIIVPKTFTRRYLTLRNRGSPN
jgi:hypothetical protein